MSGRRTGTKKRGVRGHQRRTHRDGSVYEGQWKKGKRHGHGKMTTRRWCFEGKFKDGKRDGHGKSTDLNGTFYEGEFKDDKRHGEGKLTFADGKVYEGGFKDGGMHGQGKMTSPDGTVYEGEWRDGKRHGHGKMTFADGKVLYEGEFKDGMRHGHGKMTEADLPVYEGEFKDGKPHGHGTVTWADGTVYEGEYMDGEMHGQGKMTSPDGTVHEGEFKDGERQVHLPEFVAVKPGEYRGGRDGDYYLLLLHTTTKGKVEVCKEENIGGVHHFYVRIGDDMYVWAPASKLKDYYACSNRSCNKPDTKRHCGRCGAKYCCRDCQAAHWSVHKKRCKKREKKVKVSIVRDSLAAWMPQPKGSWRRKSSRTAARPSK